MANNQLNSLVSDTVEYNKEVTKAQIAGILRKANIVRYRKVSAGQSVLRDIKTHYAHYSGVEVTERCSYLDISGRNSRPQYQKITTGTFDIRFTHGYTSKKFTAEEGATILNQAIEALKANGFVVISEHDLSGFCVAKEVA